MLRFIFRLVRLAVLVGAVLWVGQWPVGDSTVAARFRQGVERLWSGKPPMPAARIPEALEKNASIKWIQSSADRAVKKWFPDPDPHAKPRFEEEVSQADREALMRILQEGK